MMELGDRFKKYLPKFIGLIPDFDDLFRAEDKEFYLLDEAIDQMVKNGYIADGVDSKTLDRLSDIYKVYGDKKSRIERIWIKKNSNVPTTELRLREVADRLVGKSPGADGEAYFLEVRNPEYLVYFKLILNYTDVSPEVFFNEIRLILPAHLGIKLRAIRLVDHKIYYGLVEQRKNKSTLYPATGEDHEESLEIYYGACPYAKRIRVSDRPIDVWLYDDIQREVVTEKERRLKYGKDLS